MLSPLDILSLETWVLLVTLVLLVRYYINKKFSILKELGIPHHKPSVFKLGNLLEEKGFQQFFLADLDKKKEFGKIHGSYVGFNPRITISDPDILKQIFIKDFSYFPDRQAVLTKISGKVLNNQLTNVSGNQWKRIRNGLSPTFSTSKQREMFVHLKRCADLMVSNLDDIVKEKDGKFILKEVFGKMSLDSICSAAFGVNVTNQGKDSDGNSKIFNALDQIFKTQASNNPLISLFILFPWTEKIAEFFHYNFFPKNAIQYFVSLTEAIQNKAKHHLDERKDMLGYMLKNQISDSEAEHGDRKGMTKNEITANSVLMILAGYDTTSSAMLFLAYNLAFCKEAQDKLRQEIDKTIEEFGDLTLEAINSMKYVTMCINESLRLYPPVPRNARYCQEEITINGQTIPKGVHVDVPNYGMSRDPEYWDDPLVFKPERMEDMTKINPFVFQPFGAGPRNCIGMRFALIEVKLAICKVLQKFELSPCEDTKPPPLEILFRATMQPKDVVSLKATLRN